MKIGFDKKSFFFAKLRENLRFCGWKLFCDTKKWKKSGGKFRGKFKFLHFPLEFRWSEGKLLKFYVKKSLLSHLNLIHRKTFGERSKKFQKTFSIYSEKLMFRLQRNQMKNHHFGAHKSSELLYSLSHRKRSTKN